jgi:predicted house-cleaning NTP pyrophosphatase (Maf/HAM1 superfamily)
MVLHLHCYFIDGFWSIEIMLSDAGGFQLRELCGLIVYAISGSTSTLS